MQGNTGRMLGAVVTVAVIIIVLVAGVAGIAIGLSQRSTTTVIVVTPTANIQATIQAGISQTQAAQPSNPIQVAPQIAPQAPPQVAAAQVIPTATTQPVISIPPTAVPVVQQVASGGNTSGCPPFQKEVLGVWTFQGSRPSLPGPAGRCQAILADGDITNSNTCHYRVFTEGQAVGNLGNGSFEIVRLTGSPDEITQSIQSIASDLASANQGRGGCPRA